MRPETIGRKPQPSAAAGSMLSSLAAVPEDREEPGLTPGSGVGIADIAAAGEREPEAKQGMAEKMPERPEQRIRVQGFSSIHPQWIGKEQSAGWVGLGLHSSRRISNPAGWAAQT